MPKVLHVVPYALRFTQQNVEWRVGVNQVWDLTAFIDAMGIPDAAEHLLGGWGASRQTNKSDFRMLDRNGVLIDIFSYGSTETAITTGLAHPPMGTLHFFPGNTRQLDYAGEGPSVVDFVNRWRYFVIYAWL